MLNEEYTRYFLERIDVIYDEISRLKQTLVDYNNGIPYNEAWMENIFLEEAKEEKSARNHTSRIIEHIFKLKYCTNNYN